jgi:hypothetical protein
MVFICGCSIAVFRDRNRDNEVELKEDTGMTGIDLISVFGENSGALSLSAIENDPGSLEETDSFRDRVALITIKPVDMDDSVIKVPSEGEYDDHEKLLSETWTGYLPIDIGGKIVPGEVEVVLYG